MYQKAYPAKLLLFGEYTIIQGAKALAVPLPNFSGQWRTSIDFDRKKQEGLYLLLDYLKKNYSELYDVVTFKENLRAGVFFDSDIPEGYGAGSSGSVTAAVYDRYAISKIQPEDSADLKKLQLELANIESCFHGASSGADPLVCFLQKGVVFSNETLQLITEEQDDLSGFFLIDTGIRRQTAPFVNLFKKWCKEEMYPLRLEVELIPLVEDGIDAFLQKDKKTLLEVIHGIGHFQFKYFAGMLPTAFRKPWLDALASDHTKLKLCGAGGGGFILGYSTDMQKTKELLADYRLILL